MNPLIALFRQPLQAQLLVPVFVLACLGLYAFGLAVKTPLGAPPDERAHLSYIHDVMQPGQWLPDYRSGEIYLLEDNINYLTHPPLYYSALGLAGQVIGLDVYRHVLAFRIANILIVTVGMLLFIALCRQLSLDWFATTVLSLSVLAIPMYPYLAASVNNDNLVFLGAMLVFYGLALGATNERALPGFGWIAAGVIVCALTKATVTAYLVMLLVFYLLFEWRRLPGFVRAPGFWISATVTLLVVGGYYFYTLAVHGSFFPSPRSLYELAPPDAPLTRGEYLVEFRDSMLRRLAMVMSHTSFAPISRPINAVFYAVMAMPLLVWALVRWLPMARRAPRGVRVMTDVMLLALVGLLAIHVYLGYNAYAQTGALGGMQPRYYFFLLPLLFVPPLLLLERGALRQWYTLLFTGLLIVVFWASTPFAHEQQLSAQLARQPPVALDTGRQDSALPLTVRLRVHPADGVIDEFTLNGDVLLVRGWAFDADAMQTGQRVVVTLHGRQLGSRPLSVYRPDVRDHFRSPAASWSGFRVVLFGVPEQTDLCDVAVYVEYGDGSFSELDNPACLSDRGVSSE